MSFDLVVEMKSSLNNLRQRWQDAINAQGFSVEIFPGFDPVNWQGGHLPIKLVAIPDRYLFGLPRVIQISGFEVDFKTDSAHFRSANGRPLAELILQCYGAACLAVITNGVYWDPQTSESFAGEVALQKADREIMAYQPYMDQYARVQHPFTKWADYE